MFCSLKEVFDENSESNKKLKKQFEEMKQKSIEEKSCYSCRYKNSIDDGQGYSHIECRLSKKKTNILEVDKNCIYHRVKDDYKILDYDRKAILDIFLNELDCEINLLEEKAKKSKALEKQAKYGIMAKQTKRLKDKLIWLIGE